MNRIKLLLVAVVISAAAVVLCGGSASASVGDGLSPDTASHIVYQKALRFDHTLPETLTNNGAKFNEDITDVNISSNDIKYNAPVLNAGLFNQPLIDYSAGLLETRQITFYRPNTPTLNSVILE